MEVQGNGKEATKCCCSSHYNIDEQYLHREILGYTSATDGNTSVRLGSSTVLGEAVGLVIGFFFLLKTKEIRGSIV